MHSYKDVYETVCAFLNRHGGDIILGVEDNGNIIGIDKDKVNKIKKEFVSQVNNENKINPPVYLSINEINIDNRTYVPESSQVHRCSNRIFDRNEDGDFEITNNTNLVADLYYRKQRTYSENKIYPIITIDDLREDIIKRTNLIESYDRLMAFIEKHLKDKFYLEKDQRISLRNHIFREVISNILIHREYMNPFPAKLIIEIDKVITENSNKPHRNGVINVKL